MKYHLHPSRFGTVLLVGDGSALRILNFQDGEGPVQIDAAWQEDRSAFSAAVQQLGEYGNRKREMFDLELKPQGTAFQLEVWNELQRIPFGTTISYAELARRIGRPNAVRAVGGANGANPIAVVIPCHRVIGADGSLTGYGGGLDIKERLLAHEGARLSL